MNIVFYVGVVLITMIAYFFLSFIFKGVGSLGIKIFEKFRNNIMDDEGEKKDEQR